MTRDEIITLANELTIPSPDADTFDTYINDIFRVLAMRSVPPFLTAFIKALTSGTATYDFETDMLRVVYAIMYDELLSPSSEQALDAYNDEWQSDTGTPVAITQDEITARTYLLYPEPDFTSDPLIPTHGEPFGEDFPDDSLVLLYADDRESNIPTIFALPVAFDALSREFSYPSDHTDEDFAKLCQNVAQLFYRLTGIQ